MSTKRGRRTFSRRSFLISTTAVIGGLALGGCGRSSDNQAVDLDWLMWPPGFGERGDQIWSEYAREVSKVHPDINVKVSLTGSFDNYWDKLQTQLASNTAPDIISIQGQRMPGFAARDTFQSLRPFIDEDPDFDFEDFFPAARQNLSFQEKAYGLSFNFGPLILYYNKDLFNNASVPDPDPTKPMTWERFREIAKEIARPGANQYGTSHGSAFTYSIPWIWSAGGDYMNAEETECTLDSAESVEALEFLVGLYRDGIAAPITDLANINEAFEDFTSGQIGMYIDGPWLFGGLSDDAEFDWDVAPVPEGPAGSITYGDGSGFGISQSTESPEAAWKALKVILSVENQKELAKIGLGPPGRQDAFPTFVDTESAPENANVVEKLLAGELEAEAHSIRVTTTWQEMNVMLRREFSPLFLGKQSVQEVVDKVKPKFDAFLREHQKTLEAGS